MAAAVRTLVLWFDYAFIVQDLVEEILGRMIRLEALVDRRRVINIIEKDPTNGLETPPDRCTGTKEKLLQGRAGYQSTDTRQPNPCRILNQDHIVGMIPPLQILSTNLFFIRPQRWAVSQERLK